jgi:hypothetical protein
MANEATSQQETLHLLSILPLSSTEVNDQGIEVQTIIPYRVYVEAAGWLALQHFNQRNTTIVSSLPEDCKVTLTADWRDSRFSTRDAVLQLQDALYADTPKPNFLLGAARSAVSQTLAILGGVHELPQISATSTSADLDNKGQYPYFARTVPSNTGDAQAIALYFKDLGVTYFGAIYVRDSFGIAYFEDLKLQSQALAITVVAAPYDDGDDASIVTAVQRLLEVKYVVGIFNPRTWKKVIRSAVAEQIMGQPGYTWFLTEASLELTQPDFVLEKTEGDIARALHGTGVVLLDVPPNPKFDAALAELAVNSNLQEAFVQHHHEPNLFDGFEWTFPGPALYQYLNYDAVLALGLAACQLQDRVVQGPALFESLLNTEFEGISGFVSFDNETGTRKKQYLRYRIENILQNVNTDQGYGFRSEVSIRIDLRNLDRPVQQVAPFVYFDNSTITPPALPPAEENWNQITPAARAIGWTFGLLALGASVAWLVWTIRFRKSNVVQVSQPIFLSQICLGTLILATAAIPMGLQEPVSQRGLDISCMVTPWLLSMGFVMAFSALFSKTWRLNKLFGSGSRFRRIQVKAQDVILPFILLSVLNISVLTLWTLVAPMRWTRVPVENYDSFGRSVESYGSCSSGNATIEWIMIACIIVINLTALVVANYQCYKARNLPTDFNESFYIAISNASMLEAFFLGGPIMLVVHDNPNSLFVVACLLVAITCFCILLPIFVPKYLQRNIRVKRRAAGVRSKIIVSKPSFGLERSNALRGLEHSAVPEEPDRKAGESGIIRNDDYYFQRLSSAEGASRRRSRFSVTSLFQASDISSTQEKDPKDSRSSPLESSMGRYSLTSMSSRGVQFHSPSEPLEVLKEDSSNKSLNSSNHSMDSHSRHKRIPTHDMTDNPNSSLQSDSSVQ